MRTRSLIFILAHLFYVGSTNAASPMIVVSIDGLRPDAIRKAHARTLLGLIENGTSFSKARTVRPSITLPAHTSMVTGLDPQQHGIWWDEYRADYGPVRFVTALEIVNQSGLDTAMIVAKEKLLHLNRPNSVDYFARTDKEGYAVAATFDAYVKAHGLPDLTFLHLPDPDANGHLFLWMSPSYLKGVRDADEALNNIIATANDALRGKKFTLVVTADHGGFGFGHLSDIDENNKVPFIAYGENIAAGIIKEDPVRTYDVAATILRHFNLPIPSTWIGVPAPIWVNAEPILPTQCEPLLIKARTGRCEAYGQLKSY